MLHYIEDLAKRYFNATAQVYYTEHDEADESRK